VIGRDLGADRDQRVLGHAELGELLLVLAVDLLVKNFRATSCQLSSCFIVAVSISALRPKECLAISSI
jgi:hypothetical protein